MVYAAVADSSYSVVCCIKKYSLVRYLQHTQIRICELENAYSTCKYTISLNTLAHDCMHVKKSVCQFVSKF